MLPRFRTIADSPARRRLLGAAGLQLLGAATWRRAAALALTPLAAAAAGCATQPDGGQVTPAPAPAPGLPQTFELEHTPFFPDTAYHCGPAALATVLAERGVPVLPQELVQQVFLPARQGSLQIEMIGATRRAGLVPVRIEGGLQQLLRQLADGNPVVVLQNLGLTALPVWHYAVAVGYSLPRHEIVLRSGPQPRQVLDLGVFDHSWAAGGRWGFVAMPLGEWPAGTEPAQVVEACIGFERVAEPSRALRCYAGAIQRWPRELALRIGLGNTAYAAGDRVLAADSFETAAREHRSAAAWVNLGRTLLAAGLTDSAWRVALEAEYLDDPAWRAETTELLQDAHALLSSDSPIQMKPSSSRR